MADMGLQIFPSNSSSSSKLALDFWAVAGLVGFGRWLGGSLGGDERVVAEKRERGLAGLEKRDEIFFLSFQ
ncbi:unnamed protein product [Prunus armeniaca]